MRGRTHGGGGPATDLRLLPPAGSSGSDAGQQEAEATSVKVIERTFTTLGGNEPWRAMATKQKHFSIV